MSSLPRQRQLTRALYSSRLPRAQTIINAPMIHRQIMLKTLHDLQQRVIDDRLALQLCVQEAAAAHKATEIPADSQPFYTRTVTHIHPGSAHVVHPLDYKITTYIPLAASRIWNEAGNVMQIPDTPENIAILANPNTVITKRHFDAHKECLKNREKHNLLALAGERYDPDTYMITASQLMSRPIGHPFPPPHHLAQPIPKQCAPTVRSGKARVALAREKAKQTTNTESTKIPKDDHYCDNVAQAAARTLVGNLLWLAKHGPRLSSIEIRLPSKHSYKQAMEMWKEMRESIPAVRKLAPPPLENYRTRGIPRVKHAIYIKTGEELREQRPRDKRAPLRVHHRPDLKRPGQLKLKQLNIFGGYDSRYTISAKGGKLIAGHA